MNGIDELRQASQLNNCVNDFSRIRLSLSIILHLDRRRYVYTIGDR